MNFNAELDYNVHESMIINWKMFTETSVLRVSIWKVIWARTFSCIGINLGADGINPARFDYTSVYQIYLVL